jgi:molybdate transport system substrate-binding protein
VVCFCYALELPAAQVTVFAAASLTDSLREIARQYESASKDKIVFNLGGSSSLARQIEEGAPADMLFSADEAQMDRLEKKGLLVNGTRTNRLSNSLVIIVAATGGVTIKTPADLTNSTIRRIALGDPQAVPIGVYSRAFLRKSGLWEALAAKIVPTENVRAALAAVESGDADASIIYKTDALISKRVTVACAIPEELTPPIRYPVAILKGGRNPQGARLFLGYLQSEAVTKIFLAHGFIIAR